MEGTGEGGGGVGGGWWGRRGGAGVEGQLIQRFTYTRTCVSHVIEGSAAIYKVEEKYSFSLRCGSQNGKDENSTPVVFERA